MGEWTVLHISTSFFLPLLRLSFLCFVLLFIYQELCFRYCLSIRIRSKGLALCHGLWLQVCPGYFRVWVVTDEAFSLFLDPGRKKKSEDKQAKVKSFPKLTHMTIHMPTITLCQHLHLSFHAHFTLPHSFESLLWMNVPCRENTGDIYQRYRPREQILSCFHSLSTSAQAVWSRFPMAGWRGNIFANKVCF